MSVYFVAFIGPSNLPEHLHSATTFYEADKTLPGSSAIIANANYSEHEL